MSPVPRRFLLTVLALALSLVSCSSDDPTPRPSPLSAAAEQRDGDGLSDLSDSTDNDVPLWGAELEARVATPEGVLGPQSAVAVDPHEVDGITWDGTWQMERDWDETVEGGYLDFGAARLDVNGHTVLGFRIGVPSGVDSGHIVDGGGEVGYFEITNPEQHPHNSYLRNMTLAHHYVARGVVGDAIKVGQGMSTHHDAFIEMNPIPSTDQSDKHVDGAQIFRSGSARLERIVIDWNDAGTIANTTAAIFTQDDASLVARDITVLDPGGTWRIIRLSGEGAHDVDKVHVSGEVAPNNKQPDREAPTALVRITNGMDRFTLYNDVPGADDWNVEESS